MGKEGNCSRDNRLVNAFVANKSQSDEYQLLEIYSRLPAKSKSSFKCNTKPKSVLISNTSFRRELLSAASGLFYQIHLIKFHPIKHHTYLELEDDQYTSISHGKWGSHGCTPDMGLNFLPCYPNFSIIDSCNGLLLCLSYLDGEEDKLLVCNPLRKRWVALPPRPWKYPSMNNAKLAHDAKLSPHFHVVNQPRSDPPRHWIKLEVFFSETGKWVKSSWLCKPIWHTFSPIPTCFLNGSMYALSVPPYAMAINLKGGNCQGIMLPDNRGYKVSPSLGVSNESLHYMTHDGCQIQIWMMKDVSKSEWVLKHSVSVQALAKKVVLPPCCGLKKDDRHQYFIPLKLHPSQSIVFLGTHCKVFAYDLLNETVVEVCDSRPRSNTSMGIFSFQPFSPCLNPLEYSQPW